MTPFFLSVLFFFLALVSCNPLSVPQVCCSCGTGAACPWSRWPPTGTPRWGRCWVTSLLWQLFMSASTGITTFITLQVLQHYYRYFNIITGISTLLHYRYYNIITGISTLHVRIYRYYNIITLQVLQHYYITGITTLLQVFQHYYRYFNIITLQVLQHYYITGITTLLQVFQHYYRYFNSSCPHLQVLQHLLQHCLYLNSFGLHLMSFPFWIQKRVVFVVLFKIVCSHS